MAFKRREVLFETTESGCIVPTSHKLNKDGYFRYNHKDLGFVMYHRFKWEEINGKIPDGFEINHRCKNRACCNLNHLELLSGKDHAIETNENRYKDRFEEAHNYWLQHRCKAVDMFERFNVTHSTACRWIRMWKA